MLELARAREGDLGVAMQIIDSAKEYLREQGIDQWQTGYPDEACLGEDIRAGKGYLVTQDGEVIGYACLDLDGEPAYDDLEGTWATEEPYLVVHRLALAPSARGRGLSGKVFHLAEDFARERGVNAVRVDTDEDNHGMRHVLEKNGYTYRGVIWFDNSTKIAFDKTLEP